MILAIIPARIGSKGIIKKNIKEFCGKPLIAWTIRQVLDIPSINRVICSTDDDEISEVAHFYGCDVPFLRPPELAKDDSRIIESVLDVINKIEKEGDRYETVITLQCTSPLRSKTEIQQAIEFYKSNSIKSLMSITESPHPPYWAYTISNQNKLKALFEQSRTVSQRQKLEKTFIPNGSFYINDIKTLKEYKEFNLPEVYGFIMDPLRSVDIDSETDFLFAEFLVRSGIVNLE